MTAFVVQVDGERDAAASERAAAVGLFRSMGMSARLAAAEALAGA